MKYGGYVLKYVSEHSKVRMKGALQISACQVVEGEKRTYCGKAAASGEEHFLFMHGFSGDVCDLGIRSDGDWLR